MALAGPGLAALAQALQPAQAPQGPATAAPDAPALHASLTALAALLSQADMAATEPMDLLQRRFGSAAGVRLPALAAAVGMPDFKPALDLCKAWLDPSMFAATAQGQTPGGRYPPHEARIVQRRGTCPVGDNGPKPHRHATFTQYAPGT